MVGVSTCDGNGVPITRLKMRDESEGIRKPSRPVAFSATGGDRGHNRQGQTRVEKLESRERDHSGQPALTGEGMVRKIEVEKTEGIGMGLFE